MAVRQGSRFPNATRFPRWSWWMIGVVTSLAIAVLLLAIVLGVRAGQSQLEMRNRQQMGIYLQQAIDLRTDGDLDAALRAYQQVLTLDPNNVAAAEAVNELLRLAETGSTLTVPLAQPPDAPGPTTGVADASAAAALGAGINAANPATDSKQSLFDQGKQVFSNGRWQDTVTTLLQLREQDVEFEAAQVTKMLYTAYVQLGAESERGGNLEEAIAYFDSAITLRPEAVETRRARVIVAKYLDMLTVSGADWERAITLLEELYTLNPSYRDVEERLMQAHMDYGDVLADEEKWCAAATKYGDAIAIEVAPGSIATRDEYRAECNRQDTAAASSTDTSSTDTSSTARGNTVASGTITPSATATTETATSPVTVASPLSGRILYSAIDLGNRRSRIFAQSVNGGTPTILVEDAAQPALRADGQRLAYRNTRNDTKGISSIDPGSGLTLRFTDFSEDSLPSWNAEGNRVVFASNREGDRRWRIYTVWGEVNGATQSLGFGESPEWHPAVDRIVFRGCDQTGNQCGLWTMTGSGSDARPLTTVPADSRPTWTPDGRAVVFMSDGRHGNLELYRVEVNGGSVTRLTNNGVADGIPTVSPDGSWVAYLSSGDGSWKIWAVPIAGGKARVVAPISGDIGNWLEQDIQWAR